jgi:fluoroacetyl-CoA thioesterase
MEVKVLERHYVVTDAEAIHVMSEGVTSALSTPSMVGWMEYTSRDNVLPLLKPGEDTVGVSVEVTHLAATPVGMKVRVVSRLIEVEGRTYSFALEVFDTTEKIGEGTHKRVSVSVEKFGARVAAKRDAIRHAG